MIRRIAAAALTVGCAVAAAAQAAPAVDTVTLDLSGPRPIAMLAVGGAEPVPVIFDTGASGNVIDSGFARSVGLPEQGPARVGTPAGGPPLEGFRTTIAEATLGGATIRDVRAVALPMPAMQSLAVKGVFGPGSFAGRLVHLDLGLGEIRITDKDPAHIPPGEAYPYSDSGPRSLPGIPVEIGGVRFDGHIDTGNPGLLAFPTALADQLPLDGERVPGPPARLADGVPRETFVARLRGTVRVGPLSFDNPEVRFIEGLQRVNVGMTALHGVTVVLDPAERRSWLIPAR